MRGLLRLKEMARFGLLTVYQDLLPFPTEGPTYIIEYPGGSQVVYNGWTLREVRFIAMCQAELFYAEKKQNQHETTKKQASAGRGKSQQGAGQAQAVRQAESHQHPRNRPQA